MLCRTGCCGMGSWNSRVIVAIMTAGKGQSLATSMWSMDHSLLFEPTALPLPRVLIAFSRFLSLFFLDGRSYENKWFLYCGNDLDIPCSFGRVVDHGNQKFVWCQSATTTKNKKKKGKEKREKEKKRRERTFSVWATDVFPAMKKTSEGWSYLITWASSGGEEETSLELLLRGSLKPLTVNCLGILVLTYGWAETNEISHPGGQVVAELLS